MSAWSFTNYFAFYPFWNRFIILLKFPFNPYKIAYVFFLSHAFSKKINKSVIFIYGVKEEIKVYLKLLVFFIWIFHISSSIWNWLNLIILISRNKSVSLEFAKQTQIHFLEFLHLINSKLLIFCFQLEINIGLIHLFG